MILSTYPKYPEPLSTNVDNHPYHRKTPGELIDPSTHQGQVFILVASPGPKKESWQRCASHEKTSQPNICRKKLSGFCVFVKVHKVGDLDVWHCFVLTRFYCIFCFFCRGGGGWNKKTSMWIKSICWSTTGGSLLPMFHLGIQTSPPSFKSSTNEDLNVTQYGFLTPQIVAITTLSKIITLPETNKSHLEMDGWNTIVSFLGLEGLFSGANYCYLTALKTSTKKPRISSWWFQPIWKILVKLGIFPK